MTQPTAESTVTVGLLLPSSTVGAPRRMTLLGDGAIVVGAPLSRLHPTAAPEVFGRLRDFHPAEAAARQ